MGLVHIRDNSGKIEHCGIMRLISINENSYPLVLYKKSPIVKQNDNKTTTLKEFEDMWYNRY